MPNSFTHRHIGPTEVEVTEMLQALNLPSLDHLIDQTVPHSIRMKHDLDIEEGINETSALEKLREILSDNQAMISLIGQGYHDCITPPIILRNLFENPGWYTSYTPYQPEISQGRLELLFHYQTLICELTGLDIANASLLDEGTALAEAAGVAIRHHRNKRKHVTIANTLHPQSLKVLQTRLSQWEVQIDTKAPDENTAAVIFQCPDTFGEILDHRTIIKQAKENGSLVIVAADPLALVMMTPPGKWGADIAVGSMQRYGTPMANGGPHAAYISLKEAYTRLMPGRLVGESQDIKGRKAYRLALQTREQHIRREKATSNICTAQALLANISAAYAIWHGPEGLINIAQDIHAHTARFAQSLKNQGKYKICNATYFDTLTIESSESIEEIMQKAEKNELLLRQIDENRFAVSFDELTRQKTLESLAQTLGISLAGTPAKDSLPLAVSQRGKEFLTQPIFSKYRSETSMMRYLRYLVNKDLALDRAMIPLGSCTMKLNASAEMVPVSWPETARIHPFAPKKYLAGYSRMIDDLDRWFSEITGFAKISFQPNAGSQGEFAGLLAIKKYHRARGEHSRNICLIPSSAHGTNPASAQMAGMEVLIVKCDSLGNVDIGDLRQKAQKNTDKLAALMITYPSTHGVFEEGIKEICSIIHEYGGQVYFDGANLNALVGLARPGDIGADVCHMNLHKTFCIPHGGGGPGVGPIGVLEHLIPYLPGTLESADSEFMVSSAPYGSASILPIPWMYIRMLGGKGLTRATKIAILSANYLAKKLESNFPVLYKGKNGYIAHECILDTRIVKELAGISVDDIAKRLIDYGFHAPTMSWPVIGTLMIEPTESEPKEELDRFIAAMACIREEIRKIEKKEWDTNDNTLKNAPHTVGDLLEEYWKHEYSRKDAAASEDVESKYWSPIGRVDNVKGDRNLICSCPPIESYDTPAA